MSPQVAPSRLEQFQAFLKRVARPIEFASRDAFTHVSAVRNLGSFVSRQVITILSEHVYPAKIEASLMTLRNLFLDFHSGLEPSEQQARLTEARAILRKLSNPGGVDDDSGYQAIGRRSAERLRIVSKSKPLWEMPIRYARGVGPKRTALLQRLGIDTVERALWVLPWRYEDRSVVTPIGRLVPGAQSTICGTIVKSRATRTRYRKMSIVEVAVEDATGTIECVFFSQPHLEDILTAGDQVMLCGRTVAGQRGWTDLRFEPSQYELIGDGREGLLHVGRIVPVYHETKGWTSRQMRVLIKGLLDDHVDALEEVLPVSIRARLRFPPIQEAMRLVHFPAARTDAQALTRGLTRAHRRLAFEELFLLEVALASRRRAVKEEVKGIRFNPQSTLIKQLAQSLPFELTNAQRRVIAEIHTDMASPRPMNRLLQGDVGSGKTIVALHAIVTACGSGYQAALMAPTEILAEQHYRTVAPLLESLKLRAVLLTGGGSARAKAGVARQLKEGTVHVAIGTHALIQERVQFAKLGLAVVDEQHKFGVLQRKTLTDKGYAPDVLVLTATPIPRTLAMTVYGDLDVSTIDGLPPGRKPVRTWLFSPAQRRRAYQIVRDELRAGRQAYVVYPLVAESEKLDLQAAMQAAERMQREEFPNFRVGLLHGRMRTQEKERTMKAFQAGTVQILVATTVIEVGVDVPQATVMMVEHAERFGLAQLHQLRGRVGRGAEQSYCLLIASGRLNGREQWDRENRPPDGAASLARRRLDVLVKSHDGFVIAEEDLRIRGPGEFFGLRQWGVPEFRAANLIRDADLLREARREAFSLIEADPCLEGPAHAALKSAVRRRWGAKLDLGDVG